MNTKQFIEEIKRIFKTMERVSVATSGGIDSMVLAYLAHQVLGNNAKIVHATSAAVPTADGKRVARYALEQGWNFELVQTGEMKDPQYLSNPSNRCYYCKSALYTTLNSLDFGQVVSGTNLDDLDDYRPGLIAAKEKNIRHPYVEANIDKAMIRSIAKELGLCDLQDLPASPCLASRIETGIPIHPEQLDLVGRVETYLRNKISAENIRCRILLQSLVIQIDEMVMSTLCKETLQALIEDTRRMAVEVNIHLPVNIAPYRRGSAFIKVAQ